MLNILNIIYSARDPSSSSVHNDVTPESEPAVPAGTSDRASRPCALLTLARDVHAGLMRGCHLYWPSPPTGLSPSEPTAPTAPTVGRANTSPHQRVDHSIHVVKEHNGVEAQLDETLLLALGKHGVYSRRIDEVLLLEVALNVPRRQRTVRDQRHEVEAQQEEDGESRVCHIFGYQEAVQPLRRVEGVEVVRLQVRVRDDLMGR